MLDILFFFVDIFASNKAATAATFAAAITAAFASLKFYSDKAAKVTDFRKAWVETLRQAVSEFSGSTHTIAGRIVIRIAHGATRNAVQPGTAQRWSSVLSLLGRTGPAETPFDKDLETELMAQWATLRLSYNKVVLHLNPTEHSAYIVAEEAVAKALLAEEAAAKDAAPDTTKSASGEQSNVVAFLYWCVSVAESRARILLDHASSPWWKKAGRKIHSWWRWVTRAQPEALKDEEKLTGFEEAQKYIHRECIDAGSCLLLSAFATKRLLYGKYPKVAPRISNIEKGIRVVDTSAALVIKSVWEAIKKGEPAYRWASFLAILLSLTIMCVILFALFASPSTAGSRGHNVTRAQTGMLMSERA